MKIAIFGDIHGNIEALRAAYAAISHKVDKIVHLGDLGGYAPFINEVADFLAEHHIEGVQGNYDDAVANNKEHCGCASENPVQERMAGLSYEWTKTHTLPKTKQFLKDLPATMKLVAEGRSIVLFHASPLKNNLYWYEDRPEKFFRDMAARVEADVFVYGHTHRPYRKELDGNFFINAGSVGKPKDGDPRACVALLHIKRDSIETEFLRVEYDVENTARAIIEYGLPSYYADLLRQGR